MGTVTSPFARAHAYGVPGFYTVTITVTDDDGAPGADTAVIEIVSPLQALERISDDLVQLAAAPGTTGMARALILSAIADLYGNNAGASANGAFTKERLSRW